MRVIPAPPRGRFVAGLIVVAAGLIHLFATVPAAHTRANSVTWTADVHPILQRHCVRCHEPNGFAPLSLTTYEDARGAARRIRRVVLEKRMPPWPAQRGVGDFLNDPTLSQVDVELLSAWAAGGAPRGSDETASAPPAVGATGRAPDLVVAMSGKQTVTDGPVRFVLDSGLERAVWVDRWELLPGNRAVIAQAALAVDGGTSLGSWLPGELPGALAAGHAWRLPAASRLVLDVQYRNVAAPAGDRSAIALYFAEGAPREVRSRQLACGSTMLNDPVNVIAIRAHTASQGENVEVSARSRAGVVEPIVWIPRSRTDYEPTLRLRTPLRLDRGTRLTVTSAGAGCSADLFFAR
jgi:mono/diheme cytochrome c family protein